MEQAAENERMFSATMIESMPGIIYFYDEHGRFLRWNRNFETVSGYSGNEIAGMHPLDFFSPANRELLKARIAEVFANGDSCVEAPFLTKDGRTLPYFLTGRRVLFNGQPCLVGMGIDITARTQAEKQLRELRARLEVVVENLREGLIISNAGKDLVHWNAAALRMYGYTTQEQARAHLSDFARLFELSTLDGRVLPPDQWPFARVFRGETVSGLELRIRRLSGDWERIFSYAGTHVRYGDNQTLAFLTVQDITERKQAEVRLAESERKYRELVEFANSIILRWNSEGRVTLINEFGQRFFGYTAEDLVGRHVVGTIVPESESSGRDLERLMENICSNPKAFEQNVNENMRRNGERVWISWTNRIVLDPQGRVQEILSIGTDITEKRKAELALKVLNQTLELEVATRTSELRTALVRAEAADRIKSAFLATMSHELRTPLNSIIGFTGILLQSLAGPLNAEQSKQLGMVRNSARHLLALINDVLDLSKIEAGQLEVHAEPFPLREAIDQVAALVGPLAEKKGLALSVIAPPELGELMSDRRRIEQILLNLLNNAIKFTDEGRVTLTAELIPAYQSSPNAPPHPAVRLRVTDTGIGIKPEHLSALFQPFRQLDSGLARQHEGTGLGLVICRRLAGLLGGEICVTSEWGRGSEFTVTIPRGKPATP